MEVAKSLKTYRYEIKTSKKSRKNGKVRYSKTEKALLQMASDVNYAWNRGNAYSRNRWKESRFYTSGFDIDKIMVGASSVLSISNSTIQAVDAEVALRTKQAKKSVRFRSAKKGRNLPWIPFKAESAKLVGDTFFYYPGRKEVEEGVFKNAKPIKLRLNLSRVLPADTKVKMGNIVQDAMGRWYVNITFETSMLSDEPAPEGTIVGIDLGLKTLATTSRGRKYERANLTKKYEEKLAKAQKFKKKRVVKKTHAKIKNCRKDHNHKVSTEIAESYQLVIVGDVDSNKLAKTNMAKSVYDAGWYQFKNFLKYKCQSRSGKYIEISERFSTVTCSGCLSRSGPSGLSNLRIREWSCSSCGEIHDRDVNAAKNILRFGHESLRA